MYLLVEVATVFRHKSIEQTLQIQLYRMLRSPVVSKKQTASDKQYTPHR